MLGTRKVIVRVTPLDEESSGVRDASHTRQNNMNTYQGDEAGVSIL
jgi:hypothetical protein